MKAMTYIAEDKEHSDFFFRSEAESSWAYMLVNSGLSLEYEAKIYQTRHGGYCPDFYSKEVDWIFEVKCGTPSDIEIEKLIDVEIQTGKLCAFLCNKPFIKHGAVQESYIMLTNGAIFKLRDIEMCRDVYGLKKVATESLRQGHSFIMTCFSKVLGFDAVPVMSQGIINKSSDDSNWAAEIFNGLSKKLNRRTDNGECVECIRNRLNHER